MRTAKKGIKIQRENIPLFYFITKEATFMEKKSFWADIQNNYTEDVNANGVVRITYIDAWQSVNARLNR